MLKHYRQVEDQDVGRVPHLLVENNHEHHQEVADEADDDDEGEDDGNHDGDHRHQHLHTISIISNYLFYTQYLHAISTHTISTRNIYTLHLEVSLLRLGRRGETVVTTGVIHADTVGGQ